MRTLGVEEEYLLVGSQGEPVARSRLVLASGDAVPDEGTTLEGELQEQQVEISTPVATTLAEIEDSLRTARRRAQQAAERVAADIVAIGSSPLPVTTVGTEGERYDQMRELFAITAREQLTSGAHVHVGVSDDEEGVAVLDRIRPWLSVLTALGSNSPFWQGQDTGYASYRSLVMRRWPSAGPSGAFGDAASYHALVTQLVGTGAILDEGMVYFDARLSARYPTVEVRVSDVLLEVDNAVTLAGLARALVATAAADKQPAPPARVELLRLLGWRAARSGLAEELISPRSLRPHPAAEVVAELLDYVTDALEATGDRERVQEGVAALLGGEDGARRQRAWFAESGDLATVVRRAHARTIA